MAERNNSGGGTPWMAYLVAVLAVGVAIVGYFILSGGSASQDNRTVAAINHATHIDQQAKLNGQ